MKNSKRSLLLLLPIFASGSLSAQKAQTKPGINMSLMDIKVKPGDDFFRYVNGTWFDNTEIPADRQRWGSFDELRQNTDTDALNILKAASASGKYKTGTDQAKAIGLYQTIMDTVSRNKNGYAPLKPYFKKIDEVKDIKGLQKLLTEMEPLGGIGFFGVGIGPDSKNSNRNIVSVGPGSVGLPDRDYYVSSDADSQEKRKKYTDHVARMLEMVGVSKDAAAKDGASILEFETKLSEPRLDRVERRDRRKSYNPMKVSDLQAMTPAIDWKMYLDGIGLTNLDSLNVSQPKYMKALQDLFTQNNVDTWKAYMKWTLLNRYAGTLSTDLENANWEFYGKALTGAIKQRPRDERALQSVNGSIGEALGKLYVAEKFPPEAKAKCEKMISYVFRAYEKRINELPWMDEKTRAMAIAKLKKYSIKIGYPDKWRDYSALDLKSPTAGGSYFSNAQASAKWRFNEDLKDLKKPVDKTRWGMTPQTVNAYYNPSFNEIVFPAAILQPPFYDYKADEAVNFGGIGAVIGHEISHGFDDSGARYNADGNLVNWWSDQDLEKFTKLGDDLAAQYSALEPLPGIFVDGKFTLGENIGDLGGVTAAYDGLELYLKENGNPGKIDGFTPEQRFFISWGTIWRTKMRDEAIKNQVKTDPHSPGMYRSYVPLQNVDVFYQAFDIKPGDKLYVVPEKRVKIW
ncbi:M13 family metallopeptidase [Flavobacterium silvaticum]|uniref:M13 family metallopeptidase n=1 Tax=Flavobacterium silvaticum TaxID=1852020 RepID=A0A972JHS3_9FLAO|nr:M13 family metallopeptidase [Flavobacterium silvaticum]NMH28245.1 M13 family metallopeptidase [Flavobacterium silvaticum]